MGAESIKTEILAALEQAPAAMTAAELVEVCLSALDSNDIARACYELRVKKGLIEFGPPRPGTNGRPITYQIASPDSVEDWAARQAASLAVAKAQPKQPRKSAAQPASPAHPWKQAVVPPKAPRAPRVTRPLPSHLQSKAPPPVADNSHLAQWTEIVEPPVAPEQADIDAALIAALQEVADDLPKSTDSPTEEVPMSQDPAIYAPEIALPQPADGLERDPPYHAADDTFVLKAIVEPKEVHECQGHCANHARDSELWDALRQDDKDDKLEEARLALVDSLLIYAHSVLHEDAVWKSLLRPYQVIAGASLEVCHG